MATVRRHRGKWQARVRLKGAKPVSCTFHRKADAERWGVETEARLQRGQLPCGLAHLRQTTLRQMLERYRDTVTVRKRGCFNETILVNVLLRQPFADESLASLSPQHFIDYRTERVRSVKPATVNHELTVLKHLFTVARDEWGLSVENPFARIRPVRADLPRTRRLSKEQRPRPRPYRKAAGGSCRASRGLRTAAAPRVQAGAGSKWQVRRPPLSKG